MVLEFAFLPPEINSALMFGGAGAGTLFAAASAWAELASNLASSASSFNNVISGLTSGQWTGPSAEAKLRVLSMTASARRSWCWGPRRSSSRRRRSRGTGSSHGHAFPVQPAAAAATACAFWQ